METVSETTLQLVRLRGSPGHGDPFLAVVATEGHSIHGLDRLNQAPDGHAARADRRAAATWHAELYSTAMRAVICRAWGEVDSLRVEDVAPPAPAADEVLIDVRADLR